jgi:hypothetical protein
LLSVELDDEFDRVRSAICMSGLALSNDARSGVEIVENVVNVKPRKLFDEIASNNFISSFNHFDLYSIYFLRDQIESTPEEES